MKTIAFASLAALALLTGAAQAAPKDIWTDINQSAPRSTFDQLNQTAPHGTFEQINQTAPRGGYFQDLQDSAPRSDGVYGGLDKNAP
jgi:hypothetical protein